ncbi:MAG: ParA family protein [Hungatella sp.]|jgi:hypothetical protein|nr:ParA family protein [Hungatella sp.]
MEIFCVNSVKGGSGKTTVSLAILYNRALNCRTAAKAEGIKEEEQLRFAYVDLDLQGTGVSRLIYEDKDRDRITFYNNQKNQRESVKDFYYKDFRNLFPEYDQPSVVIDAYLLNDSDDAKTFYNINDKELLESRNINRFKGRAMRLMDQILKSGEYDTVVFDCAPSYDYIASDFFEHVCRNYGGHENRIVNAFVTTLEKSHVYTTISKVSNILRKSEYNLGIHVICNDITGYLDVPDRRNQTEEETIKLKFEKEKKRKEIIEKVYNEIIREKTGSEMKESPLDFPRDRVIILDKLNISDTFVFSENITLNQRNILELLGNGRLVEDLKLEM